MTNKSRINIAVAGLGWVASNRHIPIILRNPNLNLFGVIDKRLERLQLMKQKYPWLEISHSQDGEMPWGKNIQAVLIATDPLNHFALARKMLLAGKHVLMEKPLTITPDESRELINIAKRAGVTLSVVHNFQFARSTLKLQKMINDGVLGEVEGIEAMQLSNPRRRLPVWYEQLPFGLFYDETPHMLYILRAIARENIHHQASVVVRKLGQNTPLSLTGYYNAGKLPIRLSMNFQASLSEWHVAVMGTNRIGIIDIFRDILVTMPNDSRHRAREILSSSGSFVATHLGGFFTSGILLARQKLFYGSDIVWEKFANQIITGQIAEEISAGLGLHIVELQHELMNKSTVIEHPA